MINESGFHVWTLRSLSGAVLGALCVKSHDFPNHPMKVGVHHFLEGETEADRCWVTRPRWPQESGHTIGFWTDQLPNPCSYRPLTSLDLSSLIYRMGCYLPEGRWGTLTSKDTSSPGTVFWNLRSYQLERSLSLAIPWLAAPLVLAGKPVLALLTLRLPTALSSCLGAL